MTEPLRLDDAQLEVDDVIYKHLTRDTCALFHELADYRHIMGDLDYASDYSLSYWALINRIDTGQSDDRFIRSGILILLMAMLHNEFDGSGCWISKHLDAVSSALDQFVPEDNEMSRLFHSVSHGLQLLRSDSNCDSRFEEESTWAYDAIVRRYFENSAQ